MEKGKNRKFCNLANRKHQNVYFASDYSPNFFLWKEVYIFVKV
jgi:hypothetical protein